MELNDHFMNLFQALGEIVIGDCRIKQCGINAELSFIDGNITGSLAPRTVKEYANFF
ncbi:MAG TPA: hypothetical protein VIF82_17290 [Burkholderiaceae bacterium]|jgi:hypothetical protein